MEWFGIKHDEGPDIGGPFSPYRQSERLKLYADHAEILIRKGYAYYCFCTPADLEKMRALRIKEGKPLLYDGRCRKIDARVWRDRIKKEKLDFGVMFDADADRIFDILMGDEVFPRKKFIQTHAKAVKNLDI